MLILQTFNISAPMKSQLDKEFQWYLNHQEELVEKYNGRFIVIKENEVIGDYDKIGDAVRETAKKHEMGTFLVQKCSPGDQDYTQTFRSRVRFA